jgi:hypothetical protein
MENPREFVEVSSVAWKKFCDYLVGSSATENVAAKVRRYPVIVEILETQAQLQTAFSQQQVHSSPPKYFQQPQILLKNFRILAVALSTHIHPHHR